MNLPVNVSLGMVNKLVLKFRIQFVVGLESVGEYLRTRLNILLNLGVEIGAPLIGNVDCADLRMAVFATAL